MISKISVVEILCNDEWKTNVKTQASTEKVENYFSFIYISDAWKSLLSLPGMSTDDNKNLFSSTILWRKTKQVSSFYHFISTKLLSHIFLYKSNTNEFHALQNVIICHTDNKTYFFQYVVKSCSISSKHCENKSEF